MNQLFSVGELVVGVASGTIFTVIKVSYGTGIYTDTGAIYKGWLYLVNDNTDIFATSNEIKKYYPPSTKSFREIMADLKKPVSV